MFSKASVILSTEGHAWQWGSMHGRGPCVVGACMAGGMHGRGHTGVECKAAGVCGMGGGHVWQGTCM